MVTDPVRGNAARPKRTLTARELRYLTDIDHRDHEIAADVAIAVVDERQDRGVGSLLVAQLKARALQESITHNT